jgi:hypothetical protein
MTKSEIQTLIDDAECLSCYAGGNTAELLKLSFLDKIEQNTSSQFPMGEISFFSVASPTTPSITSASDGSTNLVKVAPATTLASDSNQFDNGGSDNGRLRYTGTATKMFHCACSVSFGGGNNDLFVIGVAKNGVVSDASKILRRMGAGGDIGSTAIHWMTELQSMQYLEVYVGNITDTDDPSFYTLNLFAMGVPIA